jgi:hypothetical protein
VLGLFSLRVRIHYHSVQQRPQHLSPLISYTFLRDVTQPGDATYDRFQEIVRSTESGLQSLDLLERPRVKSGALCSACEKGQGGNYWINHRWREALALPSYCVCASRFHRKS